MKVTVDVRGYLPVLQRVEHLTMTWSQAMEEIVRSSRMTLRHLHVVTMYGTIFTNAYENFT
jgi:hypothetical protein